MKIFINDLPLHDLGVVVIAGQQTAGDPPEAPQRWKCKLKVRVDTLECDYSANWSLIREVVQALRTPHFRLRWEDDYGNTYLEQEATAVGHNLPDDPNAWGTTRQAVEVELEYEDTYLTSRALTATWQRTGSTLVVSLGSVHRVSEKTKVSRFAPDKDARKDATCSLTLRGRLDADSSAPLESRRASLLAALDQLQSEIKQAKSGRIRYGTLDHVVRVDDFEADIDQPVFGIQWSLSVAWVEFPRQDGYAQAQFTATTSEDVDTGAITLSLSGQIGADTELRALSKLNALRASVAPPSLWQPTSLESAPERVSDTLNGVATGDGEEFIRLSFSDKYRKITGDVVDYELRIEDDEDASSGLLRTSYNGFVVARGATDDAAWNAAITKARDLGNHKYQFRISAKETRQSSQRQDTRHQVRVDFAYEYRRKGSRVYVELTGSTHRQPFGADVERVQGRVVAATAAEADSVYASVKTAWTALLHEEQVSRRAEEIGKVNLPAGTPSSGRERLELALEFSFEVARTKAATDVAMRYEMDVESDYQKREKTTTVSGTVYAASQAAAEAYLDTFVASLGLGGRMFTKRSSSNERGFSFGGQSRSQHLALSFTERFSGVLAGQDQVLDSQLAEEIVCSGPRRVVAPTASSNDIVQTCGVTAGRRTVRGRVTALTETTALAWARRQRHLPYLGITPEFRYETPAEISIEPTLVAMTDTVARTGTYGAHGDFTRTGVSAVVVAFTFTEILPEYDPLA